MSEIKKPKCVESYQMGETYTVTAISHTLSSIVKSAEDSGVAKEDGKIWCEVHELVRAIKLMTTQRIMAHNKEMGIDTPVYNIQCEGNPEDAPN